MQEIYCEIVSFELNWTLQAMECTFSLHDWFHSIGICDYSMSVSVPNRAKFLRKLCNPLQTLRSFRYTKRCIFWQLTIYFYSIIYTKYRKLPAIMHHCCWREIPVSLAYWCVSHLLFVCIISNSNHILYLSFEHWTWIDFNRWYCLFNVFFRLLFKHSNSTKKCIVYHSLHTDIQFHTDNSLITNRVSNSFHTHTHTPFNCLAYRITLLDCHSQNLMP